MKYDEAIRLNRVGGTMSWRAGLASIALCVFWWAQSSSAPATGFAAPQECRSSAGEAHLNCLYRYIEKQQQNMDAVESDRNAQDGMIEQIPAQRTQVDQFGAIADERGGQADLAELPPTAAAPTRSPDTIRPSVGSPMECQAYSGAAHLNCLYAYIEIQYSKSRKVQEELNVQKQMLGQLHDQVDRQASVSQDLQRRLAERDAAASSPAPAYSAPPIYPGYGYPGFGYGYGYPRYGYAAPGFSLYLGPPGYYYGRPFYGPRFFGPRFGHHHR